MIDIERYTHKKSRNAVAKKASPGKKLSLDKKLSPDKLLLELHDGVLWVVGGAGVAHVGRADQTRTHFSINQTINLLSYQSIYQFIYLFIYVSIYLSYLTMQMA